MLRSPANPRPRHVLAWYTPAELALSFGVVQKVLESCPAQYDQQIVMAMLAKVGYDLAFLDNIFLLFQA